MLNIQFTSRFKRDYKAIKKRNLDEALLREVLQLLASEQPLADRYFDHALSGEYDHCRDCHILPDWILIYHVEKDDKTLYLIRTGNHSDLFR